MEEDVLQMFFKDRALNGDFISKASDLFWQRDFLKFVEADADSVGSFVDTPQQEDQV